MSNKESKQLQVKDETQSQLTNAQRFVSKMLSDADNIEFTDFQKKLIQNYFISINASLQTAEAKRLKSYEKKRDPLPISWQNVNMDILKIDIRKISKYGLDSSLKNHINFIPYKDDKNNNYYIGFIIGYEGLGYIAKKYALDPFDHVEFQLVYTKDTFKVLRKDVLNRVESYILNVEDEFDRGEVKGGFAYFKFKNPEKNYVLVMSLRDIMKRKPKYASADFWGGTKDVWENGVKTNKKEDVEGWFHEMCMKTLKRTAYNSISLDPQKIDADYAFLKMRENETIDNIAEEGIIHNANTIPIDIDDDGGVIPSDESITINF